MAVHLHSGGNLDAAEKIYRSILESIPVQYDALHLLGVLRQQQGTLPEARELIEKALKSASDAAEAHANLGVILHALEQRDEAAMSFERSLALDPNNADARENRERALEARASRGGEPA